MEEPLPEPVQAIATDEELLQLWKDIQRECFPWRWIFQRQWHRNIFYVLSRQWIEYLSKYGGWRDKRMAPWVPRPVTNKCKESVQTIRSMFASIKLGVSPRPNGADPKNVATAGVADELGPVLHDAHEMDAVLNEFDFWLLVTGNAFLHTYIDYDIKNGVIVDELGNQTIKPRPVTCALSPLELAFPNDYQRFSDLPYVVRMRWRTRRYFESNATLKALVDEGKISWQKSPTDQTLVLFKALAQHNDLGLSGTYWSEGAGAGDSEDGVPEYEVWMKPTDTYPEGLVFRIYGDSVPVVAHLEETEALPGPLPYRDAEGNPIFTFTHASYDHVGGRVLGSGVVDLIAQKQDQLNQLDSMTLMSIQRTSNGTWLIPKGASVSKLSGMPGTLVYYKVDPINPQLKPELVQGVGPHPSYFQLRQQYLEDIENLAGTFDILKGAKPSGVEAFSAMQLLVERSQARFAGVFSARGKAYRDWFKFAIELEREFGPNERTRYIMSPARTWTYKTFKRSQLQGSIEIIVEDGSTTPKTNLGLRAAVQQASALGMLNLQDPDQQYEGLKLFGLQKMVPTLDVHVQAALRKQQGFEEWIIDPTAVRDYAVQAQQQQAEFAQQVQASAGDLTQPLAQPPSLLEGTPLKWRPWYSPAIHRQEFLKWANSDQILELIQQYPFAEELLSAHLGEIDGAMAQAAALAASPAGPAPSGGALAMGNSNRESTQDVEPSGTGEGAQNAGPR